MYLFLKKITCSVGNKLPKSVVLIWAYSKCEKLERAIARKPQSGRAAVIA